MNNFVIDRIQSQIRKPDVFVQKIEARERILPNPVSTAKLKEILLNLFSAPKVKEKNFLKDFPDLFHWVEWYLQNEDKFSDKQKQALKTLVEVRDLINVGCACKRQQRLNAALNYFKVFWLNNTKNDLLPTILKICECEKVSFGDFLFFPEVH